MFVIIFVLTNIDLLPFYITLAACILIAESESRSEQSPENGKNQKIVGTHNRKPWIFQRLLKLATANNCINNWFIATSKTKPNNIYIISKVTTILYYFIHSCLISLCDPFCFVIFRGHTLIKLFTETLKNGYW